jgi:hypothetical protein
MLMLLVFFVLVAPFPVFPLLPLLQPVKVAVFHMPIRQPLPVIVIFAIIPVVIVLVIRIVDSMIIVIPVMIVVILNCHRGTCRSRLGAGKWGSHCGRQENGTQTSISSIH